MFTQRDKVKEYVEFFAQNPNTQCLIFKNVNYKPVGVSVVMRYHYDINGVEVSYDKWYVECFNEAKAFGLPGTEHHNKLVKGSGVNVISKKYMPYTFYGKEAEDIINACEINRDLDSIIMANHNQNIK